MCWPQPCYNSIQRSSCLDMLLQTTQSTQNQLATETSKALFLSHNEQTSHFSKTNRSSVFTPATFSFVFFQPQPMLKISSPAKILNRKDAKGIRGENAGEQKEKLTQRTRKQSIFPLRAGSYQKASTSQFPVLFCFTLVSTKRRGAHKLNI